MALSNITDLFGRSKLRALIQYRSLVKYIADVGVLIAEAQELETAFWAFLGKLDLDVADGVWLDRLGGLIGEKREGVAVDGQLRAIIKARILANISHGTIQDILSVATAFIGTTPGAGDPWNFTDWWPAAMSITAPASSVTFEGSGDYALVRLLKLLRIARAIAIKFTVFYQDTAVETDMFMCGDATGAITPIGKGFDDAAAPNNINAGRLAGADDA